MPPELKKGEKSEFNDEIPDQVEYRPPSEVKIALKEAELRVAMLEVEVQRLKDEVKMLRVVQRAHKPVDIPDWKIVFNEASEMKYAPYVYYYYNGNSITFDPKPKKIVTAHKFPPYDSRNPKNIKKHGK